MKELWKVIDGTDIVYEVSNKGRVRRLKGGEYKQCKIFDWNGYGAVTIKINGKWKAKPVHRLVAIAFIPKEKGKNVVNHMDLDKMNNCVENLEWTTLSGNTMHYYEAIGDKHPLKHGEDNKSAKLTDEIVKNIRSKALTMKEIRWYAYLFNISEGAVKSAYLGESWKHIPISDAINYDL